MKLCKVTFKGISPQALASASEFAFFVAREQIGADCNRYCRKDSGTLQRSISMTPPDSSGFEISWETPYARRVYYTGVARTETNPYAHILWADYACSLHKKEWALVLGKAIAEGLNK